MTQKSIKIFMNEVFSKGPEKIYATNKTDIYHFEDIWFLHIINLKDYGPENNTGYRYVLVVIDIFTKFGWTTPLKNKVAKTIKDSFEKILINSKRKPNLIETDRHTEIYNNIFNNFINNNNIQDFS